MDTPLATAGWGRLLDTELTAVHELKTLVLARHAAIVIETPEEERVDALLAEVARATRLTVFDWTITQGLARQPGAQAVYGTQDPARMLASIHDLTVEGLFVLKDFGPHVTTPTVSRAFRELLEQLAEPQRLSTIVLVGVSVEIPEAIEPEVVRYELRLPGRDQYRRVVDEVITSLQTTARAEVRVTAGDFDSFASALSGLTLIQARQALAQVAIEDGALTPEDLERVVELKARALREGSMLEYFPPASRSDELGGFANFQRWLSRARVAYSPRAAELNIPVPKGVLLVGVQGCGKSLAAKVVARQWQQPLLKLDFSTLYDKYVGESERNLRHALTTSEAMAPVVLWIDEIEKGFAPSGAQDVDGGLTRRLFGSFLTWLQERQGDVFVVATANDLSSLPAELLRKGRFDEVFFVDLPDAAERATILRIHLGRRKQDPAQFDVERIAAASDGFSGAELEQVISASLLRALQDEQPLYTDLILEELAETVPLSHSRSEDIERLRTLARDRFVPVR
jgi:ATPase family protein associated with various cellular activities (AAA)/AAA+ lid domain-containing protein